jgi:hypothetical protein
VTVDNGQRFLAKGVVEDGKDSDFDLVASLPNHLHRGRNYEIGKGLYLLREVRV